MFFQSTEKGIIGALIAVFSFLYSCVSEMIIVLALLMIFDYITGVLVAKVEDKFDSKKGIWGVIKKLSYLMIVISGYLTDITINAFANLIGIDFNTYGALGFAVIFYLIGNEGVSLFTNWTRLGLPVPFFLQNIFINFKMLSNNIAKKNQIKAEERGEDEHDKKTRY